jgi:hypothetical protein
MVDNLKSAVLQRLAGVAPVFNPRLDFAQHHGFAIAPCNVARGNDVWSPVLAMSKRISCVGSS